jgi:hypothetical protein
MNKTILSRFFYLSIFLVLTSFNNATSKGSNNETSLENIGKAVTINSENTGSAMSASLYEKLELANVGLSEEVLSSAVKGYERLLQEGVLGNTQYLTIVDLSQSSRKKRFYLLDLENNKLALNTFVAHGKNSGVDKAVKFSNTPESEASSLGFYVTKDTYSGKHGLSLKLSGLEDGFNDNAESRAIVVHGANYVNPARVNSAYMGRSQGCPALPEAVAPKVIKMIKGGSAIFVYHPTEKYLKGSKLLNS